MAYNTTNKKQVAKNSAVEGFAKVIIGVAAELLEQQQLQNPTYKASDASQKRDSWAEFDMNPQDNIYLSPTTNARATELATRILEDRLDKKGMKDARPLLANRLMHIQDNIREHKKYRAPNMDMNEYMSKYHTQLTCQWLLLKMAYEKCNLSLDPHYTINGKRRGYCCINLAEAYADQARIYNANYWKYDYPSLILIRTFYPEY